MSQEAVLVFLEKADGDAALSQELEQALDQGPESIAGVLAVAARHGYEFSAQELAGAMEEEREISDEALEGVSGGAVGSRPLGRTASRLFQLTRSGLGSSLVDLKKDDGEHG